MLEYRRDPPLGGSVLRAFQNENKAGQIQHQNMTSLSVWPVAKVDAWGSADPVSSGAGNFAGWDWLSWLCSIIHLCFVQFFSAFTPFTDVYFIKFRRLFYINHCVMNISGSTNYAHSMARSRNHRQNPAPCAVFSSCPWSGVLALECSCATKPASFQLKRPVFSASADSSEFVGEQ